MARRLDVGQFCGRSLRRRRTHGFVVTENRFQPGLEIASHAHVHPHFTFVLSGGFTERYRDRVLECHADSVLFVPAEQPHTDSVWEQGAHSLGVELSPAVVRRLGNGADLLSRPRVTVHEPIRAASHRLYREFFSQDSASDLCIESLALEILVLTSRMPAEGESAGSRWMARVVERLHEEFCESVTLESLAEEAGVHVTHLARAFRKAHGCTVGEYVRRLRLESASRELRNGSKPISQIALETGFHDAPHFCRVFRRAYGVSPREYRIT